MNNNDANYVQANRMSAHPLIDAAKAGNVEASARLCDTLRVGALTHRLTPILAHLPPHPRTLEPSSRTLIITVTPRPNPPCFNCISALGYTQEVNRLLATGINPDDERTQVSLFWSTFR